MFIELESSTNAAPDEALNELNNDLINDFKNVTLENGEYCLVTYFKDFKNIYLSKAVKSTENIYEMHNLDVILKTIQSEGMSTVILIP